MDQVAQSLWHEEPIDPDGLIQILGPYPTTEVEEENDSHTDDTQA